jgi:heterodisulfide reductase subunit A-like polyferredoxin
MSRRDAESALRAELPLLFPGLRADDIARVLPIREKRATFLPKPGLEKKRPGVRSGIPGLYLAGDWTGTGLPATIESAARSAEAAAAAVVADLRFIA